jgi:uncharacterized protein YkwD
MLGLLLHARGLARAHWLGEGARKRSFVRFCALAGVIALAFALPAAAKAQGAHSKKSTARCAGASSATRDLARLSREILCLHERERGGKGLGRLRWNPRLARAAAAHARDMVRRHYFDHRSPQHKSYMDMVSATGYGGAGCWSAGENLALSHGAASPRQLMTAWMKSPEHRRNILRHKWHDFGLGVVRKSPSGEPGGLTIVVLFGTDAVRACR